MRSFQLANESSPLSLTPDFILPEDKRPQLSEVSTLTSIPIIDLNDSMAIQNISQACEEYGFFQIVNHGVPEEVCNKMMAAASDFFELAPERRAQFFTRDHKKEVKLYSFYLKVEDGRKINMWSESFSHHWHSVDHFIHLLPENFGLSTGLDLEEDCFQKMLGDKPTLKAQANFYPPCPDPELTLGLAVHTDLNALTVRLQSEGVTGLQVIKDGKWVSVPTVPNAFIINLGDQIQVLSNGRYRSVHHRAVTNKLHSRVSMAMFYGPNIDAVIGPIQDLIDEEHPPKYKNYRYGDFLQEFFKQEGTRRMVKELFELPN
ncbi:hypothetical protein L6164_020540 [Bauhinia variegata]|uniref:Uncharacterized protein n=1 Tax=Bauhinia variegata TaxID=167791 RepID=A0ACB9MVV2_BAUVA|nr:hypothetical protein L6164_020540 [Bauhinia variegata]